MRRLRVFATSWPWQGYGWRSHDVPKRWAPLNRDASRFGGGWRWSLGLMVSARSIRVDLLIGSIIVTWSDA